MDSISFGEYLYAGGFIQKTTSGPPSYTPNKKTDINKWFNSWKLQKITQDGVQDPPYEGEAPLATVVGRLAHSWAHSLSTASYAFNLDPWF
jgi:hypothetical protein